jgi:DNA-binding transcriptional MerR regulator
VTTGDVPARLTIAELAERSGVSVRNIRAHQSRGLLPPPEVRGRVAYYGDRHLARLALVRTLQGIGFNLAAIRQLLGRAAGHASLLAELRARIGDGAGAWQELTPGGLEFLRSLGTGIDERLAARGAIRRGPDGTLLVHPAIVGCVAALRDAGFAARELAEIQLEVLDAADRLAGRVRATLDQHGGDGEATPLVVQLVSTTWEVGLEHGLGRRVEHRL